MLDAVVDRREMRALIIRLLEFMVNPEIKAPHLDVNVDFAGNNGYNSKSAHAVLDERPSETKVQQPEIQTPD
jgi:hypothetical protein